MIPLNFRLSGRWARAGGKTGTVFHEKAVDVNQNSFFALFVGWMFLLAGGAYSKTGYLASIRTLMGVFAPGARL
jgi:hypothetical protein